VGVHDVIEDVDIEDVDIGEVGSWSDAELLGGARAVELSRRRTEGVLIARMVEIERRKLYVADGFQCLAAWGRGVHRWDQVEARSRRNLTKLATICPDIIQRLLTGQIGVAQAHLLGRLFKTPRVGRFVPLFLTEFLNEAAVRSYPDFEQHVREWRRLVDQDGLEPGPERDRELSVRNQAGEFHLRAFGPAIDGAVFQALLERFVQLEWDTDWNLTVALHGEQACPDLMPRSSWQRRYDAFRNLLDHVTLPCGTDDAGEIGEEGPVDPDDIDPFDTDPHDTDLDSLDTDESVASASASAGSASSTTSAGSASSSASAGSVSSGSASSASSSASAGLDGRGAGARPSSQVVVNIVTDLDTFLNGLNRMFDGTSTGRIPEPFGPGRGFCHTTNGDFIQPRDAVLAALYGKIRVVIRDEHGHTIAMSKTSRLFTGALRDAILMSAVRCTHPGCLVGASMCQIDHITPSSLGGATDVANGSLACRHHNNWRWIAKARVTFGPNGHWTTHRRDGTNIAPPDTD
jgi:hypothetical protein